MPSTSKLRRIFQALSVPSAVACVLLIALWARSYYRSDNVSVTVRPNTITFQSIRGRFFWQSYKTSPAYTPDWWTAGILDPRDNWSYFDSAAKHWRWMHMGTSPDVLVIPYWSPVLFAAALAAVPWINYRFSLRTLLIATTLVALGMGMLAWAAR